MKNLLALILAFVLYFTFSETTNAESNQTPPTPCITEQHRAFDFWIGEWDVTAKGKNKPHAKSSITKANNGCSIHEHYTTNGGYSGNSINFYDANKKQWHQTWIDNQGAPLYLDGLFQNGKMILSDSTNRISWSTVDTNKVNQVWEQSNDQGKTWKVIFDGLYTPVIKNEKNKTNQTK